MLINGSRLIDFPILSLHVGGEIARVTEPIIDPNTLKIIALRVDGPLIGQDEIGDILPIESVREVSPMGMVIDSYDELVNGDDVVRLQKILKLKFSLTGLKVVTKKKEKLGKVSDYIVDEGNWEVFQIIVQRPVLKALLDPELMISRQHIIEVDDYRVVVKEENEKAKRKAAAPVASGFVPNFVNPFRNPDFTPETNSRKER